MPPRPTLKIAEIFGSVQGEGLRQGEPSIFVRLAGCNLRCSFCDTKRAWQGGEDLPPEEIVERIRAIRGAFPASWVSLTGGEPFLQDLRPLAGLLKKEGLKIQVETNGTKYYPLSADWLTVSPKPRAYRVAPEIVRRAREVKLIVTRDLSLRAVRKVRRKFPSSTPLILQPESNRRWSQKRAWRILNDSLAAGLKNIRISLQLHKVLGLR
jgi:7-carboxy-7-deazaguanine synthase